MSIDLSLQYPGRVWIDANNPRGTMQNSTVPGAYDKTPLDEAWGRDVWGFLERIIEKDGFIPSGTPDTALLSQRFDALVRLARNDWPNYDAGNTYIKSAVVIASDEKTYQSLQAGNLNKDPVSNPAWWVGFNPVAVIDNLLSTSPVDALSANQGKILKSLIDDLEFGPATTIVQGLSYLAKDKTIANNGGNPDNNIDFSSGKFDFDDGSGQALAPVWLKNLSLSWGSGSGQGMLDTGSISSSTWYYLYEIYNPTSELSDYIATATLGGPSLPAGYTKKQYRASIYRQSNNTNAKIRQNGNDFTYLEPFTVYNTSIAADQIIILITPLGLNTKAFLDVFGIDNIGGGLFEMELRSTFQASTHENLGFNRQGNYMEIMTDTSSQIFADYIDGPGTLTVILKGYRDFNIKR